MAQCPTHVSANDTDILSQMRGSRSWLVRRINHGTRAAPCTTIGMAETIQEICKYQVFIFSILANRFKIQLADIGEVVAHLICDHCVGSTRATETPLT